MSILICDDDESCSKIFREILSQEGYEVHCVDTGEAALNFIKKFDTKIVILDVVLPNKSGHDILKEIKLESPNTQVIIMTGYANVSTAVSLMRDGAHDVIRKPSDIKQLITAIETASLKTSETRIEPIAAVSGVVRDYTATYVDFQCHYPSQTI